MGDSVEILDLEIPLQEFYAYQIVSTSTSKKSGRSYSDQIFIKHNSGLRFPLGIEETVYESKDKGNFSRFAKLSRYLRKYQKIHQLPVLDMLDEPMKGLLVPSPLLSSTPERKHSIPNPQYPIHWKYKVTLYPFYFLFFFFVPGHLGLAFLILKFKRKETVLSPILFLLLGYLVSGCIYYKWVWEKKDLGYKLDKSESTFYLYETRKNSPDIQIAKLDTKNDFVYELEIPMKRVTVFTSSYYKSLKRLYRSLQSDTIESEDPLNVIPSLFQVDEIQTWDFSDLAMETVLRILVDWKEEERLSW
ncbi:hypothetical protein LPTSP4_18430 [Leptospira ryugenii]|uniref:Uncharacterized protein n=1 Tax=Leptospira ryugenii TaxID=1917863 RepID=A0A2P2E0B0_9LEPT|nr:hypothetical protein LPTSP4_18430 [Leptospira ryugenii]